MATFGQTWQGVAAQLPGVDPLLCREWTLQALRRAAAGRRWGFLRKDLRLRTEASRTVAATVTQGSTTVTGAGFESTDVGRRLRVAARGLPYQIVSYTAGAPDSVELHVPYQGTGTAGAAAAVTATVFDAWLILPADFDGCRSLRNLTVQRPMPWWLDADLLDQWDPERHQTDTSARVAVARGYVPSGTYSGRVFYEWWPYPTAVGEYDLSYYSRPNPADGDNLPGVFEGRGYVLQQGALAFAAGHPGAGGIKNPTFNLGLRDRLMQEWERELQALSVRDDDLVPGEQVQAVDWRWVQGQGLRSDRSLRSTDATVADYY